MWWTSRASPVSTTRPICRRVPSRTRWWCTAATASSDGHRRPLGAQVAVGQDDDVHARARRARRPRAQIALEATLHARRAPSATGQVMSIVRASKTLWSTWRSFSSCELRRIGCGITSWWQWSGVSPEQVDLRADARLEAHDDRLAQRVDRRVGDLREQLLEVGEQRRAQVGQDRQRDVVAHRAGRLGGVARHRREQHAQVLLGPAEGELLGAQRLHARHPRALLGQVLDVHDALVQPLAVGPAARRASSLISSSGTIRSRSRSTRNSLPGLQAALGLDRSSGTSNTPVSEASTTQPSLVTSQRPGRRPLRSSVAPITRPSVKATAAGPSQGSISDEW